MKDNKFLEYTKTLIICHHVCECGGIGDCCKPRKKLKKKRKEEK